MKTNDLLDNILQILYTVKENRDKLQKILRFLKNEVYVEQEKPEEFVLPEKYKKVVSQIADSINTGFICYLNPETLLTEDIPQELINNPYEFEMMTGESLDSMDLQHSKWENCICFEPLKSYESFKIMKLFAENMTDTRLQMKLINSLNRRKPFANFKAIIDDSPYRQDWFDFKKQWLENHIKKLLLLKLEEEQENHSI